MLHSPVLIESAGTALAFALSEDDAPVVTHWGAAPAGDADAFVAALADTALPAVMHSSSDRPRVVGALPSQHQGWSGAPALELHRGRRIVHPRLRTTGTDRTPTSVAFDLEDEANGLAVRLTYDLDAWGVLRAAVALTNRGDDDLDVDAVRVLLPVPLRAHEVLDLTGRWAGERRPQRAPLLDGAHVRAARRGRQGHDAPLLEMVGTAGFGFRSGEVWAAHVAWSGDAEHRVERLPEGAGVLSALLGGGELLGAGEIVLEPGGAYRSPDVVHVWSDAGVDGLSDRLHPSIRAGAAYPSRPRPLTLNTWEAVYFDQSFDRLAALADRAQEIGVERFVLDDGWFLARRDDTIGLGDWEVDEAVWPDGLDPLADHVHGLGMEFGLWFEPEMVNPGSRVALEHPEWILGPAEGLGGPWRNQHVLDLADPGAYDHLLQRMDALVGRLGVDFIKWDHNRDLLEAVDRRTGGSAVHAQTLAVYRLMDALRARHPGLEIESCASGGGRVDLGMMAHAQRVWASDTNDAIERQRIQRWTSVLLPPELIGTHVGPERSHTTARVLDLPFRLATSLLGHAGIEWDVSAVTDEEVRALASWAALYRSVRGLLASGRVVRADDVPAGSALHGVVAEDGTEALLAWVRTEVGALATTPRVPLPGLDPAVAYRVTVLDDLGRAERGSIEDPTWLRRGDGTVLPGDVLTRDGLPLPALHPGQAVLLRLVRA